MSKKSSILAPKHAKRKRKQLIGKIVLSAVVGGLALWGISYIAHLNMLRISHIQVVGSTIVDEKDIIDTINKVMSGNYFFIFPKNDAFAYPAGGVRSAVLALSPQIEDVSVGTSGFNTLKVNISERKPYALWCAGEPLDESDCYFMDITGFIFSKAAHFSGNVYFHYYGGLISNAASSTIGQTYLSGELDDVHTFIESAGKLAVPVLALNALADGEFELKFTGGTILFNDRSPLDQTFENLKTMWDGQKNLSQVDLRYGNKVYFKTQ